MPRFTDLEASPETYFRAVILFGRNVASYKFALGQALLTLAGQGRDFVTLDDLAPAYVQPLLEHLQAGNKQGTFAQSHFLDACQAHLQGDLSHDDLLTATTKLGFKNVIDAFHVVGREQLPMRFFVDERRSRNGLALTDELLALPTHTATQYANLPFEIDARWRLVETAWTLRLPPSLLQVTVGSELEELFMLDQQHRRRPLGRVQDALNGYQKGHCFYCSTPLRIDGEGAAAEVDHVFPHVLMRRRVVTLNLDGVWNLVLACLECNRGVDGKGASVPARSLVERLHRRNEHFITSHHPLRETLLHQLGLTEADRRRAIDSVERAALEALVFRWMPAQVQPSVL